MNEGAVHDGHALEDVAQTLAQVVAVLEGDAVVEDDVNFDIELVAGMVGLQALDLADGVGEAHGEIEQDVALIRRGAEARQVLDVLQRRLGPVEHDDEGQEQTTQSIHPPDAAEITH